MIELINVSFSGANFISSFLLILIILYWLTVIVGFLDFNFLDVDIDVDAEADMDVDADTDANAEGGVSWLNYILRFLNIGRIPFMIWLSFFTLIFWLLQVTVNQFFGIETFIFGLITLIPLVICCALIAKFLTLPFVGIFEGMEKESMSTDITGSLGTVTLINTAGNSGQAKVKNKDNIHTIYVYTQDHILHKGDQILVISFKKDQNTYLVEPYA